MPDDPYKNVRRYVRYSRSECQGHYLDKHPQAAAFTTQRYHDTSSIVGHERTGIFNQVADHLAETQIVTGNIEALLSGRQLAGIEDDFRPDLVAAHFTRCRHEIGQKRLHIDAVNMFAREFRIETRSIGNIGNQAIKAANVVLDDVEKPLARFLGLGKRQSFDSTAQRGEGFFNSWLTSAAKLSIASIRV